MKKINNIWEKFEKIDLIGSGVFSDFYRAKNKTIGEYVAIKEIKKSKIGKSPQNIFSEIEIMNKLKSSISLIESFETSDSYYLILELYNYNLEQYLNLRKDSLSIDEIRDFLLELNKGLKEIYNNKIIHRNLKLSNILMSINKSRIDKTNFKISDFRTNNFFEDKNNLNGKIETKAPEILKEDLKAISFKSDIWSLGIIIYYLLFKEYPFKGNDIIKQIESNKKLKVINDKNLDNLIKNMLIPNVNQRISWEQYFEHPFFKNTLNQKLNFPLFTLKCKSHSKNVNYYCSTCKNNICDNCLKLHSSHKIYPFNKIGISENELKEFELQMSKIEFYMNQISKMKSEINSFIKEIKSIKDNISVYENDNENNYKYYSIKCLNFIKEKIKIDENIILPIIQNNSFKWELKKIIILIL